MKSQRDPAAGDSRTDHDLVYAARDGDTIAFDALFRASTLHLGRAFRTYLRHLLSDLL